MARPGPWSVKGVDDDARQIAREAAFREGLTIGAWIDRAIRARTGNLPGDRARVITQSPAAEQRLDAVTQTGPEAIVPEAIASINSEENLVSAPGVQAASAAPSTDQPSAQVEPAQVEPEVPAPTVAIESTSTAKTRSFPTGPSPDDRIRDLPRTDPVVAAHANAARRSGGLPRSALAVVALVAVGGLGVWAYSTIGTDGSSPSKDQVTAASKQTGQTEAAKPETAPVVAARQSTSRAALILASAEKGDARAQFDLGVLHMRGDDVAKDPALAASWFEKAAKNGLPTAQFNLGTMLLAGTGVPKDEKTAYFWFQSAAEQGHPRAQYNLGAMYLSERGAPRDYTKAESWFKKAADQGDAEALYSLGVMHENGYGMKKDQQMANTFYSRALSAGSAQAAAKMQPTQVATQSAPLTSTAPTTREAAQAAAVAPASGGQTASVAPASEKLNATGIADIQRLLGRLDLAPGQPDGVLGKRTVDAIKMYQRFAGLRVDGQPTETLLADLRQVVGAMGAERPADGAAKKASGETTKDSPRP